jgi:hypothetical protein
MGEYREFVNRDAVFSGLYKDSILPVDDSDLLKMMAALGKTNANEVADWYASKSHIGMFLFALEQLKELSKTHGFQVLVIPIPYLSSENSDRWAKVYQITSYVIKKFGFDRIDLYEDFSKVGFDKLKQREADLIHPNTVGHSIMAEKLANHIRQSLSH